MTSIEFGHFSETICWNSSYSISVSDLSISFNIIWVRWPRLVSPFRLTWAEREQAGGSFRSRRVGCAREGGAQFGRSQGKRVQWPLLQMLSDAGLDKSRKTEDWHNQERLQSEMGSHLCLPGEIQAAVFNWSCTPARLIGLDFFALPSILLKYRGTPLEGICQ